MLKKILFSTCLFAITLFSFSSFAMAQAVCPEGMQLELTQNNVQICVPSSNSEQTFPDQTNVPTKKQIAEEILRAPGFELDFGIGYAIVAAFDLRLKLGYEFGIPNANGLNFGLFTDIGLALGYPQTLTWNIIPALFVHGTSFRMGIGLGIGIFYDFIDDEESEGILSDNSLYFEIKPLISFDWFLSKIYIGFQFDIPLIFQKDDSDSKEYTEVQPWYNMDFHIGYKF